MQARRRWSTAANAITGALIVGCTSALPCPTGTMSSGDVCVERRDDGAKKDDAHDSMKTPAKSDAPAAASGGAGSVNMSAGATAAPSMTMAAGTAATSGQSGTTGSAAIGGDRGAMNVAGTSGDAGLAGMNGARAAGGVSGSMAGRAGADGGPSAPPPGPLWWCRVQLAGVLLGQRRRHAPMQMYRRSSWRRDYAGQLRTGMRNTRQLR